MSLKETITNILFGSKQETGAADETGAERESVVEEAAAEPLAGGSTDPARLELPPEHPLFRLYDLRRRISGYLPAPLLSLDEKGALPPEMIQRELGRLRSSRKARPKRNRTRVRIRSRTPPWRWTRYPIFSSPQISSTPGSLCFPPLARGRS